MEIPVQRMTQYRECICTKHWYWYYHLQVPKPLGDIIIGPALLLINKYADVYRDVLALRTVPNVSADNSDNDVHEACVYICISTYSSWYNMQIKWELRSPKCIEPTLCL